ncbi:LysR family transcriptional regulator [Rouxiella badensis]|uniref:LysR family transcriptional regulator n=1 Tax=Rouxiella badensis TaxID=1646377 RepID=UPI001D158C05|nr:LysR family transcriptional regulator [Rouxiella badensis]MCC3735928.1 LysR family transcriptional regulator [Rouxiella badensis]MCC3761340.1 LysR family transcriptional regulator [Rouxiella badensis]
MKKFPDLQQIETFLAIVRNGSFRKAAKELNLSPSSLTNTITNLEDKLGVRLLNRSTRSLSLTVIGEEFLNNVIPVFDDYTRIIDNLNHHKEKPEGSVKVNMPRVVVDLFFQDYFIKFKETYPDITLEIFTTDSRINILDLGFDAGIRYIQDVSKDMIAIPFGPKLSVIPVASPSFVSKFGFPSSPKELINFRCINRCFPSGSIYKWEFIAAQGYITEISVNGDLVVDSDTAMIQAAEAGLGIAFVYEHLVRKQLKEGILVRLLPNDNYPADNFYIYYPSRKHIPIPLRTFITWVMSMNKNGL